VTSIAAGERKALRREVDHLWRQREARREPWFELIRAGVAVHAFNQRDIAGILAMIRTVGALVGAVDKAEGPARRYESRLGDVAALVRGRPKPKVYFEEWDDPLISGIGWVSELIEIAGGEDVFPELRNQKAARDRIVSPHDVIAAAPDVILASWCGLLSSPIAIAYKRAARNGLSPTSRPL
jgi:iron complex transport system substrate-binding protein